MRLLLLDIETAPHTVFAWGLWKQNISIDQIAKSGKTIAFAAKWLGEKDVMYYGLDTHSERAMIRAAHKLLSEADAVIHYNGSSFDIPTLNKEFVKFGLKPPTPYKQIDLLRTARSQFRFASNKLDYVAQYLGLGSKVRHKGMELWLGCMAKDPESWKVMQAYNKQDVVLLEKVYKKLLPWITNHPNMSVYKEEFVCPSCGSSHFKKDGFARTNAGKYQRYRCNECGTPFSDNKNLLGRVLKSKYSRN